MNSIVLSDFMMSANRNRHRLLFWQRLKIKLYFYTKKVVNMFIKDPDKPINNNYPNELYEIAEIIANKRPTITLDDLIDVMVVVNKLGKKDKPSDSKT